eukprot:COSAG01_NODE_2600_length_7396_cov_35.648212_2_plen_97_part_00
MLQRRTRRVSAQRSDRMGRETVAMGRGTMAANHAARTAAHLSEEAAHIVLLARSVGDAVLAALARRAVGVGAAVPLDAQDVVVDIVDASARGCATR